VGVSDGETREGRTALAGSFTSLTREHPGIAVTSAYVAASAIGMVSSSLFYSRFGINVFHYAQLSDFVIVAVRNPWATVAILLAIPVVWFITVTDDLLVRHVRWYKYIYGWPPLRALSRSLPALALYFVLYAWAFSLLYAGHLTEQVHEGRWRRVEVQLQSGTYAGRDATRPFLATLLGATSAYVFLYDGDSERATIVPVENLGSMRIE
jgi:hypothetical protein